MNEENKIEPREGMELSKKDRRELRRQERRTEEDRMKRNRGLRRIITWGGIIAGFVLLVVGMVWFVGNKPTDKENTPLSTKGITGGDWVKGEQTAPVVITEYLDFQCPACKTYALVVKSLAREFAGSRVAFVYRQFPLRQIHANADAAARASEAAGLQGKFLEMHDILFDRQDDWAKKRNPEDLFFTYAEELGLDRVRFESDWKSDAVKQAVEDDYSEGVRAGVNAIPSFFLNGNYFSNPPSYDEFKSVIEQALNTSS